MIRSCKTRTRPILITALALVAGASVIFTDPIFQGMAISLASGVLVSTVLTLIVIPLGCVAASKDMCEVAAATAPAGQAVPCVFEEAAKAEQRVGAGRKPGAVMGFLGKVANALVMVLYAIRGIGLLLLDLAKGYFAKKKAKPAPKPAPRPTPSPTRHGRVGRHAGGRVRRRSGPGDPAPRCRSQRNGGCDRKPICPSTRPGGRGCHSGPGTSHSTSADTRPGGGVGASGSPGSRSGRGSGCRCGACNGPASACRGEAVGGYARPGNRDKGSGACGPCGKVEPHQAVAGDVRACQASRTPASSH